MRSESIRREISVRWLRKVLLAACLIWVCSGQRTVASEPAGHHSGTFSVVAYDSLTGELGVAVQSKHFAVGTAVPYAESGVGALATQAKANLSYGPEGISLLKMGVPVSKVVEILTSKDYGRDQRQLGIVDAQGRSACYTGVNCSEWAGHIAGHHYAVQGNILVSEEVVAQMARTFERSKGTLGERLLAALQAGQEAGGDRRGKQSAALVVVKEGVPRFIDLRVDDHAEPIKELARLFALHERLFQPATRIYAGKMLLLQGKSVRAQYEFDLVLRIADKYPEDAQVQNGVAWALATNDLLLDDALRVAKRAIVLAPEDANIWDTLAEVFFRRGDLKRAVEAEMKAVQRSPETRLFKDKLEKWRSESSKP